MELLEHIAQIPQLVTDLTKVLTTSLIKLEESQGREEQARREAEANEMLTIQETCQLLKRDEDQVLNYRKKGLEYYKKGKEVWYRRGDIQAWLASGKVRRRGL